MKCITLFAVILGVAYSQRTVTFDLGATASRNGNGEEILKISSEETNGGINNLIEFNLDFTSAGEMFFESFLCPNSPTCEEQSIFRAFVHSLGEYTDADILAEDFSNPQANLAFPRGAFTQTATGPDSNGVTLHYFEATNGETENTVTLFAEIASGGTGSTAGSTGVVVDDTKLKWGLRITNLRYTVGSGSRFVLFATLGNKGIEAVERGGEEETYVKASSSVEFVTKYGDDLANAMYWEPTIFADPGLGSEAELNVNTIEDRVDPAYFDIRFVFGDKDDTRPTTSLLWDPTIGGFTSDELASLGDGSNPSPPTPSPSPSPSNSPSPSSSGANSVVYTTLFASMLYFV